MVRLGAAQPATRSVDWRSPPGDALARVELTLWELKRLVHRAGEAGCGALALPEDTLGLGLWEAGNPSALAEVLPGAVERMLDRLGRAAAAHRLTLVCCSDTVDDSGVLRNTAFLLGPDGREIGRYHKVNLPIHEQHKRRGEGFPVFTAPGLGRVGMLICYDMVFPEAARCLALGGAGILFHPTLGGAAIGGEEISRAAFRTRAVENFVYLVVAQRRNGALILSPRGQVLAEGRQADDLVTADIDPRGGREGGDAFNHQEDMRARLFRERWPAAYGLLTDPHPPVLEEVPEVTPPEEAVRVASAALTTGEERFREAEALAGEGRLAEALRAFEALRADFPRTWIDRVSAERLTELRGRQQG